AVSIAKQVTGEIDEDVAVSKFRTKLSSRAMFFNSKPFPANESDENAFSVCSTEASAQRYCPQRWKAYEVWKSSAGHIMNALRLVIETGLHSFGMDRTTAIRLFDEYAWDSSDLASKEVTRYQSMMGQGVSYMIGQNAFKNARKYAEDKLGSRFSIREFHYQVLHQGELTFDYLEKYVQHYVRGKLSTCCTPRDESAEAKRQRRTIGRHWRRHAKRLPRDPWRGVVHT
ncbi:predicted protein, partial [Nematostella vectensis]